jgi:hypothetical protein
MATFSFGGPGVQTQGQFLEPLLFYEGFFEIGSYELFAWTGF